MSPNKKSRLLTLSHKGSKRLKTLFWARNGNNHCYHHLFTKYRYVVSGRASRKHLCPAHMVAPGCHYFYFFIFLKIFLIFMLEDFSENIFYARRFLRKHIFPAHLFGLGCYYLCWMISLLVTVLYTGSDHREHLVHSGAKKLLRKKIWSQQFRGTVPLKVIFCHGSKKLITGHDRMGIKSCLM